MCEHKNLRTVGDRLFCKDCKEELPIEFLLNQCKPEEPAAEEPSEVIEEGNLEAEEILEDKLAEEIEKQEEPAPKAAKAKTARKTAKKKGEE